MNIFLSKPDFISTDIRTQRPRDYMMPITADVMAVRHQLWFANTDLTRKRVLDLGCCVAATGAWVLDHGADHYTGVDLQQAFVDQSVQNLSGYYPQDKWKIIKSDIIGFLENCQDHFDVVVIAGSIYSMIDYYSVIKHICRIGKEVIIESYHPYRALQEIWPEKTDVELMDLWKTTSMVSIETSGQTMSQGGSQLHDSARPSMAAFAKIFAHLGWSSDFELNELAVKELPDVYSLQSPGYAVRFILRSTQGSKLVYDFVDSQQFPKETAHAFKRW
jgi:hypothetical protein